MLVYKINTQAIRNVYTSYTQAIHKLQKYGIGTSSQDCPFYIALRMFIGSINGVFDNYSACNLELYFYVKFFFESKEGNWL